MNAVDISQIRSEIKFWERSFKETNGRDPSLQDIKDLPQIEEKYRLYKRLNKAASQPSQSSKHYASNAPTTPPRKRPTQPATSEASIPVTSRLVETTAPLRTYNPFSPQKKKQFQKGSASSQPRILEKPLPNPFATPVKGKGKAVACEAKRGLSPEPFPLIKPEPAPSQSQPAPNTAFTRARKRLRGEPVSPSPNKNKKRRSNMPIQSILPFKPNHNEVPGFEGAKPDDDWDDEEEMVNFSFVGESPVKRPTGGKAFQLLFEDVAPLAIVSKGKAKLESHHDVFSAAAKIHDKTKFSNRRHAKTVLVPSEGSRTTGRKKRRLSVSDAENDDASDEEHISKTSRSTTPADAECSQQGVQLIPPSPPPNDPYETKQGKASGRGKGGVQRKKAKVSNAANEDRSDGTDDWEDAQSQIRVVNHSNAQTKPDNDNELDIADVEDPLLAFTLRNQARVHTIPKPSEDFDDSEAALRTLSTPLSKLSTLNLSTNVHEAEEAQLVQGLLYGRPRKGRLYDARRGGEIWGVGEGEEEEYSGDGMLGLGDEEFGFRSKDRKMSSKDGGGIEDDDWEGEPVPWEVGEL